MEVLQTVPILRIFDVAKAKESYQLYAQLGAKNYRFQRPGLETAPWNARVMQLTDPFGNRLRFNEELK